MSHTALYRKYRPQTFDQVRGQSEVVNYLQSIASSGRVPHALLLTGSRGIGKTTLARIFAREIGIDPHDVYEIDAASYRKVENMRELLNDMLTLPISSPYKMYILDEVHMLTSESFNTLLKTLEEPPKHVIFVLATTELHKVLPTIISRCQVLRLKKPTTEILAEQIIHVASEERKTISPEHARLIAIRSDGSFRDALVLMDQLFEQSTSKEISQTDIDRLGLRVIDHYVYQFLQALADKNTEELLKITSDISTTHEKSISEFLEKLIQAMRLVLYVKHAPGLWTSAQEQLSDEQIATIQKLSLADAVTPKVLETFLSVHAQVRVSTVPSIPVELAIIDILGNTTKH
jgi:DNA polymerase-3 subunit gamma/tau